MAITFFCQKCGKRFDLDERMVGRRARCKQCQHEFVIPNPSAPAPAAELRPAPRPVASRGRPTAPVPPPPPPRGPAPAPPPPRPRPRGPPPPRARPPPPPPAPKSPVHAPFGLEDEPANPSSYSPPSSFPMAGDDEEFLPPRLGKP